MFTLFQKERERASTRTHSYIWRARREEKERTTKGIKRERNRGSDDSAVSPLTLFKNHHCPINKNAIWMRKKEVFKAVLSTQHKRPGEF